MLLAHISHYHPRPLRYQPLRLVGGLDAEAGDGLGAGGVFGKLRRRDHVVDAVELAAVILAFDSRRIEFHVAAAGAAAPATAGWAAAG